jgi:iron complex outermembrane receptor protein
MKTDGYRMTWHEPGRALCGSSALALTTAMTMLLTPSLAAAQDAPAAGNNEPAATQDRNAVQAALEEIVVTATKRGPENVQNVPSAISAFGAQQLEALNFRDLQSLSYKMPNVQLDGFTAVPGFANFSIRGQGIAGTQTTLEPTVGTFVDGIYQGVSVGVVVDNFDLEGIEVLRGPQGLLFGRNVTGGAVLIKTTKPNLDRLTGNFRAGIESGPSYTVNGTVSGPITDGLAVKLAAYYNKDEGYFKDDLDGTKVNKSHTFVIRPAILWKPADTVSLLLRAEHGENEGNAPATKNLGLYSKNNFKFANNVHGPYSTNWDQVTGEVNIGVGFGDGTITNLAGWRKLKYIATQDVDGTPLSTFLATQYIFQEQASNELRYAGTFGNLAVTTGVFYFWQNVELLENRVIGPNAPSGGGDQTSSTLGIFGSLDWSVTDTFKLSVGARYNRDHKEADVSIIRVNNCNLTTLTCINSYSGSKTWTDVTPRVGFEWKPRQDLMVYGYYAKGFRSGGFPLRVTDVKSTNTPFDPETQHAYEIGFKGDFLDRRVRLNVAGFYNRINGLQRTIIKTDPVIGVIQTLTNTADAEIKGVEAEVRLKLADNLVLFGNAGYTDSKFTKILFDLSGDGVIDSKDFALKLPRLAPWSYGISLLYNLELPIGTLTTNIAYNHRDKNFYDDANRGPLPPADLIDANLSLAFNGTGLTASVYVKNLTNEVTSSINSPLPNIPSFGGVGAAIFPPDKGRVLGAELRYSF